MPPCLFHGLESSSVIPDPFFCHLRSFLLSSPTPIGDPVSLSLHAGFRPHTTRGGLRGFGPARRGSFARPVQGKLRTSHFVSAKEPKTSGARAGPPRGGAFAPVPVTWAAELAALRQSSPPYGMDGTGGAAPPAGAKTTAKGNDTGSSITNSLSLTFLIEDRG